MRRRDFLTKSAMAAALCCTGKYISASPKAFFNPQKAKNRIGIQLYSVNKQLPDDFAGTIKKLADMGYSYAEAYGYNGAFLGKTLKETNQTLNEHGMQLSGTHCGSGLLPEDTRNKEWDYWRKGVTDMMEAGGKHLVQSWLPAQNLDELKKLAAQFNKIGEMCLRGGVSFGYHNHHAEFKEMDGHVILDFLIQNTDPKLVFFQMDLGHTLNGGGNILEYHRKYPGRFLSWHASDFKKGQGYCEVGKGDVPYEELFKIADSYGIKDLTVEQETEGDIFASCKNDFDYLIKFPWTTK